MLPYIGRMLSPHSERPSAGRIASHLGVMFAVAAVMGVVVAGLAIPFAGVLGLGARDVAKTMDSLPAELKTEALPATWAKLSGHPCWRVQKALDDAGVEYEVVKEPWLRRSRRTAVIEGTGQSALPALELEDGSWYREQSAEMERAIRAGRLGPTA